MGRSVIIHPTGTLRPQEMRIHESDQLNVFALYEHEIEQHLSLPNCQKLKTVVKRCMDHKMRTRNFQAGNERIDTGVLKTHKGKPFSADRKQGECCQWKAKTRKGKRSFRHDENEPGKAKQSSSLAPKTADSK